MLKEKIISKIGPLIQDMEEKEREIWKEFLITLAEYYGKEELKEKISQTIYPLVDQYEKPEDLIAKIDKFQSEIEDFPVDLVLKEICLVLGKLRIEEKRRLSELNEILSELATPVIQIWKGVLLVPLIGTLDSERAQRMGERLLRGVSDTGSEVVILDITGMPTLDTVVCRYLLEFFNALRLLGAELVLCGIKPEVAYTLVKVGVDFGSITIKRDLESALSWAIEKFKDRR